MLRLLYMCPFWMSPEKKKKKQPHKAVGIVWYPEGDEIWIPAVYEISDSSAYCS